MEKFQWKIKKFLVPNLKYYQFQQDSWKNNFSGKTSWIRTCSEICGISRLLRKSCTILNDLK